MPQKIANRARRVQGVLRLARRLSWLAASPLARAKVFAVAVGLGARWILRRPSGHLWELHLRVLGRPRTFVVSDYGELQVMRDVLLDEAYAVPGLEPRTILDAGANIGIASAWFRTRYPDARIVAVEPDPASFAKLARNLGDDASVTLIHAAVARESGEVALFRSVGYSIASSLSDAHRDGSAPTQVPACTLDELCANHRLERLDLLKLDVEGAELDALDGFSQLENVGTVVGEAHPPLLEHGVDAFFERLQGFDVERVSETEDAISFVARRV